MNITLVKLKGVITELRGIRAELARLADCWEAELAEQGYRMRPTTPPTKEQAEQVEITYVEEDLDWARETIDQIKREDQRREEEAKQD